MILNYLILIIFTSYSCTALPTQKPPNALNLHQNLSLHDINQLGKDQRVKALLDVQTTIDEVQKLLTADPSLPRLTKGEIKDLFEKVTSDELQKSISNGDIETQEFMKNLILAIPYHSDEISLLENLAHQKASTMPPNVEPVIPDELKKLLKNHGLLKNDDDKSIGISPLPILPNADHPTSLLMNKLKDDDLPADFDSKVYEAFKPLSVDSKKNISAELDSFLKQFGLNGAANQKSLKKDSKDKSMVDSALLTPNYKKLLDNIGIKTSDDIKFEHLKQDIQDAKKVNKKPVRDSGPNPIKYDSYNSGSTKKEVKRQPQSDQPTKVSLNKPLLESSLESTDDNDDASLDITTSSPSSTTTTTTVRTTTTTEESSTTEESKKNTLEDEIEPIDEVEVEPLPSPRRSGFYMIFDWNTFLEVGEDPQKIVVRFSPRVGDPTRFLPVTVP